ncbi:hypothetical protein TIFTF001_033799 [Ficus carica]|uniref:Uncharacterized protein n=1 Tax=Ficus carica TaxID=3494 RepID=A0AA88J9R5_FICCA|nr:hypothetical protein TIFTF001_033799 [Ficus carica]
MRKNQKVIVLQFSLKSMFMMQSRVVERSAVDVLKGKLKKMKEKYADQDEEERSTRMALLALSTMKCIVGSLAFSCHLSYC